MLSNLWTPKVNGKGYKAEEDFKFIMVPNGKLEVKGELKSETTEQMISTYVHEQQCENRNTT